MSNFQVSIVIPCFNYGSYLSECIESILSNDFDIDRVEIIVVDDGSSDNTRQVAVSFGSRIRYIYQENSGLSSARNAGMEAARGNYLLFLDADDMLTSNTISSQALLLDENSDVDIAVCQTREELSMTPGAPRVPIGFWLLFRENLHVHFCHLNIAPPHAFMIRREKALQNGLFDTKLRACEDYDFWFRCAAKYLKFITNTATCVVYRKHVESMSARKENQLSHDTLMHFRTSQGIAQSGTLGACYETWLAHASGCLVTAFRLFSINSQQAYELFDLSLHSIIKASKKTNHIKKNCEITQYYANKLMLHLSIFASIQNPILHRIEAIMSRMHPQSVGNRAKLMQREDVLIQRVHHSQYCNLDATGNITLKKKKHVLLCSDFFWPSLGGCELFLEDLGAHLVDNGYVVHVVTRALSNRLSFYHKGMHIIQFKCSGRFRDRAFGEQYGAYAHFFCNAHYDTVFIIGQPDSWLHAPLLGSTSRTPVHLIPIINPELVDDWSRLGQEHLVATVLRNATSCLSLTEAGLDARYIRAAGVSPTFVPHALTPYPPLTGFRKQHGIPSDITLLVHVGNFWPVKNQLELIQKLNVSPGDWQLLLIGAVLPWQNERKYYKEIVSLVSKDPRMRLIGQLSPHEADTAISEADILLLSSKAECRPLVILQAMHHGTPWIATPECNSVHNDSGGIVCDINSFPENIDKIIRFPALCHALGALGNEHWNACFCWDKVLPLFIDIIENGKTLRDVTVPSGILRSKINLEKKYQLFNQKN
jgi:glycosyltransferase involved in cell wall biosynthesis